MLIEIKAKTQLPIIGCLILPIKRLEQFLDVVFDKEGTTKNTHDLKYWSIEFEVLPTHVTTMALLLECYLLYSSIYTT